MARERGVGDWLKGQGKLLSKTKDVVDTSTVGARRRSGLFVPKSADETKRQKEGTTRSLVRGVRGVRKGQEYAPYDAVGRPLRDADGKRIHRRRSSKTRIERVDGMKFMSTPTTQPKYKRRRDRRAKKYRARAQRQAAARAGRPIR